MKDIYRHGIQCWEVLSLSRLFTRAIVLLLLCADCCAEFFLHSQPASQPASTNGQGTATICLVQSSLQGSSVQVARRGHSASQPTLLLLGYFALLFACALIWIGNPSDISTSTFCEVFTGS